ncbi:MAG TPA: HD domain-containing protein [Nitrospirae bacterium]|nr:deoxyguanosinetriphosphate triphosphohydrolase [bacterium BMS3Abin06]HDH13147.1 HD domain-containing protein [Nitrospirota bacterium]HDZ03297.1 HD domain-containing protein [Nitrospirota bacterium]
MAKTYEIRDPIYGFIELNDWEREIINHPVFQRLRRIRQLGLTDMVYPGAMHTRFEHSLGVMHVATRMFDEIVKRRKEFLESELSFTEGGLERDKVLVRISCLLHDVGHAPFSHAAEELMITDASGKFYKHENYSAAAVAYLMQDVIEKHPFNQNYGIKAQDIADFLNGRSKLGRALLWRDLLSSQLDADRADYLLRDSHHIGVAYGKYDLNRLLVTMTVAIDPETDSPTLAVEEGGIHAAEALIVARYMMFTQVYFQHTRRAYDHHLAAAIKTLLSEAQSSSELEIRDALPPPTSREHLESYLKWNDWRVLGLINDGNGGGDGHILRERAHHRRIFETPEVPGREDLELTEFLCSELGEDGAFVDKAESSWYKFDSTDVPILLRPGKNDEKLVTLSQRSSVVHGLKAVNRSRIYTPYERREDVRKRVEELSNKYRKEKEVRK